MEFVQKYFADMKPTWHTPDSSTFTPAVDKSIAQYTGGMEQVIINNFDLFDFWQWTKESRFLFAL